MMSSKQVRWAILGTSHISEKMALAIQASDNSQLVAIGSRSADAGKKFADKFSLSKIYTDHQALLDDDEIDAVYIGLPNHLHKEWVIRCAKAGKHILCEKPFVLNAAEAREAFAAVEKAGVFCMEALMYCHHPLIKKLQELIRENVIGDIKLFNAVYSANIAAFANPAAGGSIRNLGCYPVSLIRMLANAEPVEIIAMGRMSETSDTDNQASVLLKFPNHVMAMVSSADDIEMVWRFDVLGTKGRLQVVSNPWMPDRENNKIIITNNDETSVEINVSAEKPLYTYQIENLADKILNNISDDVVSWQHSIGNVAVLDAWFQQVKNYNNKYALVS